jgi:hypothetical protein
MKKLIAIALVLTAQLVSVSTATASGKTTIVNLSNDVYWVSSAVDVRGQSNSGMHNGSSGLFEYIEPGWAVSGWYLLGPGEALTRPVGLFHVTKGASSVPITWGKEGGYLPMLPSKKFNAKVRKKYETGDKRELIAKGYVNAPFERLGKGIYRITGTAYRISTRKFPFGFQSRGREVFAKTFHVPGRVINIDYGGSEYRWAHVDWSIKSSSVTVSGVTKGQKTSLGGKRHHGFYRGAVTVYYVEQK